MGFKLRMNPEIDLKKLCMLVILVVLYPLPAMSVLLTPLESWQIFQNGSVQPGSGGPGSPENGSFRTQFTLVGATGVDLDAEALATGTPENTTTSARVAGVRNIASDGCSVSGCAGEDGYFITTGLFSLNGELISSIVGDTATVTMDWLFRHPGTNQIVLRVASLSFEVRDGAVKFISESGAKGIELGAGSYREEVVLTVHTSSFFAGGSAAALFFDGGFSLDLSVVNPTIAPVANAGPDQSVRPGTSVTLDGSHSFDPQGQTPLLFAWTITAKPAGSVATLIGADTSAPSFIPDILGNYTIQLVVTNTLGTSSVPDDVMVSTANLDVTPPETMVDSGPTSPTTSTSATFVFSGSDDVTLAGDLHFECRLDGGTFAACTSPLTYSGLLEGSHTFQVRAMDDVGNVEPTPANFSWNIDLTAPAAMIDSMPLDPTNSTSAIFAFHAAEANSTLACSLDGGAFVVCLSPLTYDNLGDGSHTFAAQAMDAAGNQGNAASFTWLIDIHAPDTLIDTAPAPFTNSNMALFTFHATEGATFTCQRENQVPAACTSPLTYTGLGDGLYTFSVTAIDAAGNTDSSPASVMWVVDTVAPDTSITGGPADSATTTATTATFLFTGTDNITAATDLTFECSLDGAAFDPCPGEVSYSNLNHALHTFTARAQDQAGNRDQSPASRTWTVVKLTPVLTWANPANIPYPTALSGIQLNATADTAGTFVYTPAAGTVLNAGSGQTLSVLFTPDDTTNYSQASTTVQINVVQGSQTITVTQGAPATAAFNTSFLVVATASSGLPVAVGVSGACSASGTTITITSGTRRCTVTFTQAGNANYLAAPQVVQTTTAQKANQTITVIQGAPATTRRFKTKFPVAATASSGLPVAIGASGACSINGSTVTIVKRRGTCTVTFTQAGNANYLAAPQVVQTTTVQ